MFGARIEELIRATPEQFVQETLDDVDRFVGTDRMSFFR
jgi:hypothetical protein